MPETPTSSTRERLLEKLKRQSVAWGNFVLSSGGTSKYYIDCKLTTMDAEGACLVGEEMLRLIQAEARRTGTRIDAVGGLTMGADPIAQAIGMTSWHRTPEEAYQVLSVRKSPKAHGKNKLIEGNFQPGMNIVVIDDVITRGDSTLKAVEAIEGAGGKVAFIVALVDREEGGCDKIRALGYTVLAFARKSELIEGGAPADAEQSAVAA